MAAPPLLARATSSSRRRIDRLAEVAIAASALITVGGIVLIFVFVFKEALPVLVDQATMAEANLREFFTLGPWQPVSDRPKYSLFPLLVGSLKATVIAVVTAVPIAVLAALFTAEFAPRRVRELLKPVVELLAGIPSVVLGFFALMVLASILQQVTGSPTRLNAVNAGIALGFSILPVVYSVSEDALRAVPRSYREASLALGASSWQTAFTVTLPAAWAGIFAAVMLGVGRAVGETMIVLMASGNAAITSIHPYDSIRTMSATIAAELAEVVQHSPHYATLFFIGSLLFAITFVLNVVAGLMVDRMRRHLTGA
ncbi:MAG: phosphate ABC transporter permease subunit PstC [Candidatus Eisenbacteria bacterium]